MKSIKRNITALEEHLMVNSVMEELGWIAAQLEGPTDVRLQVRIGSTDIDVCLHTGDPSYDTDHTGYWGASSIDRGISPKERAETARELVAEALDAWEQAR